MPLIVETDIEKYLITRVKNLGGWCLKIPATYREGIPDRLVLLPKGKVAFVETKRPQGGVVAPMQTYHINKLRALGFRAEVVKNYEEIDKLLEDML